MSRRNQHPGKALEAPPFRVGSPSFTSLWKRLHRGHYSTDNKYFVHWFSRVVGEIR